MAEHICVSSLRFKHALYPRADMSSSNLARLKDAISMGAVLPPVIVEDSTKYIIDGWHRVTAIKELHGNEAFIDVELREYASQAEAFEDAIVLNAGHGMRVSPSDYGAIQQRAAALGLEQKRIAVALKVPIVRLHRSAPGRHAVAKSGGSSGWANNRTGPATSIQSPEQRRMALASVEHDDAVMGALRGLAESMTPESEIGPGHLSERMRIVQSARKSGSGLRDALLATAALFVWWAARTKADDAEQASCRECGSPMLAKSGDGLCGFCRDETEQAA